MAFKRRAAIDSITLPIGDEEYTIPSPSIETGLMVQGVTEAMAAMEAGNQELAEKIMDRTGAKVEMDDDEELEFYDRLLSDETHAKLRETVDYVTLQRVVAVVMVWVLNGRKAAEDAWNSDGEETPKSVSSPKQKTSKKTSSRKT